MIVDLTVCGADHDLRDTAMSVTILLIMVTLLDKSVTLLMILVTLL